MTRRIASVWSVCVPEYDNYDFTLYATRDAAIAAIKAEIGGAAGAWSETFDGRQIEFQEHTPVRRLSRAKRVWSLEEVEVIQADPGAQLAGNRTAKEAK